MVRFCMSINRSWAGEKLGLPPDEKRWARYNGTFMREEHTSASFLHQITEGYSFTAVLGGCSEQCCGAWCTIPDHKGIPGHCGRPKGYRKNQHFQSAQFIALDFDTGDERSSIDYLQDQPHVAQFGTFLYTTLSHTSEVPKARVLFITDAPFTCPDTYRRAKRAVMARLHWGDASVHDPSRMFYGSHPGQGQSLFLGNLLPLGLVDDLIEQHPRWRQSSLREAYRRYQLGGCLEPPRLSATSTPLSSRKSPGLPARWKEPANATKDSSSHP